MDRKALHDDALEHFHERIHLLDEARHRLEVLLPHRRVARGARHVRRHLPRVEDALLAEEVA